MLCHDMLCHDALSCSDMLCVPISTHVYISMSIHLYVNMCVYKHIHTHTHTSLVCMCMHLYVCLFMHVRMLDQMLQMFFTFAEQARSNTVTTMRRRTTGCLHLLQRSRGMRVRAPFVVLRTCLIARSCVSCRRWTELNSSAPRAYIPRHSARHGKQLRSHKAGAGVWNCRESCTRENENTRTLICSISRHPALHHTQSCHEAPCRYSRKLRRRKPTRRRSLNARTQSSGPKGTAGLLHVCVYIYIYIYTHKNKQRYIRIYSSYITPTYLHTCIHTCVYIYIYVCVYTHICTYVSISIRTYIHTHLYTCASMLSCVYIYIYICVCSPPR